MRKTIKSLPSLTDGKKPYVCMVTGFDPKFTYKRVFLHSYNNNGVLEFTCDYEGVFEFKVRTPKSERHMCFKATKDDIDVFEPKYLPYYLGEEVNI